MSDPIPNLKPSVSPAPPGGEDCGCCAGIVVETPQGLDNRGGLSAIAYRIGDYAQFRASLHAALTTATALRPLRTRDDDDFTIGVLDAFACAADVLTFYQERLANESYLRTATERVSLQEMGKLVGYRLRPGVAAETWLAFALETPPAPPERLPPEPGNFVTGVPEQLSLDAGLKVQSVPPEGQKPQTFETVEPLADARPEWNAMRPWLGDALLPGLDDTFTYLEGVSTKLKPGDALVFLGDEFLANTNNNNWDFRVLDRVDPHPDSNRTLVSWKRGLGSITPPGSPALQPQVHALRKRAAVFGHNAPMWKSMTPDFRGNPDPGGWLNYTISPLGALTDGGYVDLDTVYADAANGSYVVLAKGGFNYPTEPAPSGTYVELFQVTSVAEVSRADFAISSKLTRLRLKGANYSTFVNNVRETAAFVASEQLSYAEYPVTDLVSGDNVPVAVAADGLEPGRRLIIRGSRDNDGQSVVVQATLVQAHPISTTRCKLEITPALPDALSRDSLVVYGNVALASHGESVSQILGAGDASRAFQRFPLQQLPLTYRAAANETGAKSELTVRVGDVQWQERATMYGADPSERAFVTTTDEQGRDFVVFGNGLRGARPPSGVNNVRARYRKGLGVAGNVAPEKLTQLMSRPLGLKSVSNPLAAEGGTDPEPVTAAQQTIPLTTRTLGRVVSLLDYEDYARGYSGIAKAQAQVLSLAPGPVVAITVAGADPDHPITPASPVWSNLQDALRKNGDPHVVVILLAYQASTFQLGLRIKSDTAYDSSVVRRQVEATLREHYGFASRALGQAVQQSDVVAVAQAVPGVVAVDIRHLYGGTEPVAQTAESRQDRLLASRMRVAAGAPLPAELLTLDPGPLHELEEMT